MFALVRAITYASVFIGFVLIYLPSLVLEQVGIPRPPPFGGVPLIGWIVGTVGAVLAPWCVLAFGTIGQGTPAPFDPPRKLVVCGPYRFVRNPMYIGATLALLGAALVYESLALLGFAIVFFAITHLFVVLYEEPTLARMFGAEYDAYRGNVRRWLPVSQKGSDPF
jgi:protein-S-isoprenylcysteine O-methyltransferase Ste14